MKKLFLIIMLCYAGSLLAQSPCESAFSKATKLYNDHKYAQAKEQFQKVTKNCDSKKDIAVVYIELCDAMIKNKKLAEANNNAKPVNTDIESLNEQIARQNKEIQNLQQVNLELTEKKNNLDRQNEDLHKENLRKDAIIQETNTENIKKLNYLLTKYDDEFKEIELNGINKKNTKTVPQKITNFRNELNKALQAESKISESNESTDNNDKQSE